MTKITNPLEMKPADFAAYTWICTECGAEYASQDKSPPAGWDICHGDGFKRPTVIRCGACNDAIEQEYVAPDDVATIDCGAPFSVGFDVGQREKYTILMASAPKPFRLCLSAQGEGNYRIALSPEQVLTLYNPDAFLLDADEAEALAADLTRYAAMAREPGTLGGAA